MKFTLKPHISPSEKEFKQKFGEDTWKEILKRLTNHGECESCGFYPADPSKKLQPHIFDIDEENPNNTKCALLCNACHSVCHIDKAIELNWVKLVNSKFTQEQLIQMSRTNQLIFNINNRSIVELKKHPEEFLGELLRDEIIDTKIKVLFKSNFPWGDI